MPNWWDQYPVAQPAQSGTIPLTGPDAKRPYDIANAAGSAARQPYTTQREAVAAKYADQLTEQQFRKAKADADAAEKAATAPATLSNAERVRQQAIGLPMMRAEADPLARIKDPKQREMAMRQGLTAGMALNSKFDPATAYKSIQAADELMAINRDHANDHGTWLTWARSQLGGPAQPDWLQRELQLTNDAARAQHISGEGTTSNWDAQQYVKMVAGPDKSAATNAKWAVATKAMAKNRLDYAAFNDAYLQANSTMAGAQRMWRQYVDANPVFDSKGNVRPDRKTWDQYFSGRAQNVLNGRRPDGQPRGTQQGVRKQAAAPAQGRPNGGAKFLGWEK